MSVCENGSGEGLSDWDEAFARAWPRDLRGGPPRLFYEDREDLTLIVTSDEAVEATHTFQHGLSASTSGGDAGPRWVHLGEATPEDVERVVGSATDGTAPPAGIGGSGLPAGPPRLVHEAALDWLRSLHAEFARDAPTATIGSRWVQFDQQVRVGRAGERPSADRRRGCRVRAQAWLAGAATGSAVVEAIFRPDSQGSGLTGPRPQAVARGLAERLRRRLHARPAPGGERAVVLAPGIGGVLAHELVGHALEADTARSGSWLAAETGQIASPALTVVDDPRRGRAAWRIDDEGQPGRPTPLLSRGRVRSWLHDLRSAGQAGVAPSGHGRRASYRERVRPRMGCTFVAAGESSPEEVLEGVNGIYVRRMEAAHFDVRSGRASFRVTDADAIEGGRLGLALQPMLLHIDARRTLGAIDRVADDLCFDPCVGSCQRDGQSLAISVGAPTIRIGVVMVNS